MSKARNKIKSLRKSLIAFDFDGTITTAEYRSSWQAVHEYFGTWATHGKNALHRYLKGEITYTEFCTADAYPWIHKSEAEYQKALANINLRPGLEELVSFFREHECILVIISQGLGDLVKKVAIKYKFDFWIANELIRKNNKITGDVVINVDDQEKGKILRSLLKSYNIPQEKSIAIGDASADIELFQMAQISIAIEPSSNKVAENAKFVCESKDLREIISFFE